MTSAQLPSSPTEFIVTKEYRRFAEFCDACREARYIGLCCGVPGVGKTASARQYPHWNELEGLLGPPPYRYGGMPPRDSGPWRTMLYTPGVINNPRTVEHDVDNLWGTVVGLAVRTTWHADPNTVAQSRPQPSNLVIVDEADRLKTASLEQLRDFYDRRHIGLVLTGMSGLQRRLARYAQLYSRVRFVDQFRALSGQELQSVIERQWVQLGFDAAREKTDSAVVNAIARVTGGNFRMVQRLFAQIERIMAINGLPSVTTEVVALARERLVIGPP